MKVYKTRPFAKWADNEGVSNHDLLNVIDEMLQGQVEASLGGHLYKKRLALKGGGKRGGARVILAFVASDRSFFIYGFSKNESENISTKELAALKGVAKQLLSYSEHGIKIAIKTGELYEVISDEKQKK